MVSMGDKTAKNTMPVRGKVGNVRTQWQYFEDGALANQMQDEEFGKKYDFNRCERRTARVDVPTAKVVHSKEEERLQKEEMMRLHYAKEIADKDEAIAQRLVSQMILEEQDARIRLEMNDEEMAKKLQEAEEEKYARRKKERDLQKQREKLERELEQTSQLAQQELKQYKRENGRNVEQEIYVNSAMEPKDKLLRKDGKIEDLGDFSDFYVVPKAGVTHDQEQELIRMQDEELARLLQEQEHKRGASLKKDKQKAIEAQDEELAKVIQEQERIRMLKRKEKRALRKQQSAPGGIQHDDQASSVASSRSSLRQEPSHSRSRSERQAHPAYMSGELSLTARSSDPHRSRNAGRSRDDLRQRSSREDLVQAHQGSRDDLQQRGSREDLIQARQGSRDDLRHRGSRDDLIQVPGIQGPGMMRSRDIQERDNYHEHEDYRGQARHRRSEHHHQTDNRRHDNRQDHPQHSQDLTQHSRSLEDMTYQEDQPRPRRQYRRTDDVLPEQPPGYIDPPDYPHSQHSDEAFDSQRLPGPSYIDPPSYQQHSLANLPPAPPVPIENDANAEGYMLPRPRRGRHHTFDKWANAKAMDAVLSVAPPLAEEIDMPVSNHTSQSAQQGNHPQHSQGSNVIAAIDPTFHPSANRGINQTGPTSRHPVGQRNPAALNEPYANFEDMHHLSGGVSRGESVMEDPYCELSDLEPEEDAIAPVQGQRRQSKGRKEKEKCKQQ